MANGNVFVKTDRPCIDIRDIEPRQTKEIQNERNRDVYYRTYFSWEAKKARNNRLLGFVVGGNPYLGSVAHNRRNSMKIKMEKNWYQSLSTMSSKTSTITSVQIKTSGTQVDMSYSE